MKLHYLLAAILPLLFALNVSADELPELGDVSQATISPRQERQLGLQIMTEIRADRSYLDDPEIAAYLTNLGNRLLAGTNEDHPDQEFEFFALQDPSINAFALPGGFMGFNSGLILAAQGESELAGVMAHEIAHVTQKHLARMISGQKYGMLTTLASLAVAILVSRSNPQAGQAAAVASQALAIQSRLDFTRDHEKEADRIGLNILVDAGLDPNGMTEFFERLQKAGRFHENGAPSYLRTHPITYERIADIQNRTQSMSYRQVPDSLDFQLVRAKLRALQGKPKDAVSYFESSIRDKRYNSEVAERYGLINALLRDRNYVRADKELTLLYEASRAGGMIEMLENHRLGTAIRIERKITRSSPMIETLAGRVKLALGHTADALGIYRTALRIYPQHRALTYDYAEALLRSNSPDAALKFINQQLLFTPNDVRLYNLQAQGYAALGSNLLQHRAQAEAYIRQGYLAAAIDQLQTALRNNDGDFYQVSSVEARLKELRELAAANKN
ncbi:MAG: M48 family metalloprotease [Nitrosospira sp.]|nr:M48 family metalloprotease [Nitrosospira sp.]